MDSTFFDEYVKEGYRIEGPFLVNPTTGARIKIDTAPLGGNPERSDKSVTLIDESGRQKSTSSIMMGYNKAGIKLSDGTFISSDDLTAAIIEAVSSLDEGKIVISTKTGERLDPTQIAKVAHEAAGLLRIKDKSSKITNQDTRTWSVEGPHGEDVSKGVAFLGNDGFELDNGEYVSLDEAMKALQEYVIASKDDEPIPVIPIPGVPTPPPLTGPEPTKKEQKRISRVTKKRKSNLPAWITTAGLIAYLASGLIKVPVEIQKEVQQTVERPAVVETIDHKIDYTVGGIELEYETEEEAIARINSGTNMGDTVTTVDGQDYYYTGNLKGNTGTFGKQGNHKPGDYKVTGFAISKDGKLIDYIQNFDGKPMEANLGEFLEASLEKAGLTIDDVQISIHLGENGKDRAGWTETVDAKTISNDDLLATAREFAIESGTQDFDGSTITLEDGTVLTVVDENGSLLPDGTIVKDANGTEYKLSGLAVQEHIETETVTTYVTETHTETVETGKKITFSAENMKLAYAVLPGLAAVAAAVATHMKNKKSQKNPSLYEFESQEEYDKFVKEFKEALEKYEKQSGFGRVLRTIFIGKTVDVLQNLTEDQSQELYQAIMGHANKDFEFNIGDRIEFKNGRVFVTNSDGKSVDITDKVMSDIASIGQKNEVVTEGLIEEDTHGFHR